MLLAGATESAAVFEQFPGSFVQFDKFKCHLLGTVSAADMNILIEIIKG